MALDALGHANRLIEEEITRSARELEGETDADVLAFFGDIRGGCENHLRDVVEGRAKKRTKLVVVLETNGGSIEVVQRMVDVQRKHYAVVDFIIPDYAMSAGTVWAMSGDAIWMDYFSILGPIDPQVEKDERLVPALGYLEKYDELVKKSAKSSGLTPAEIAYLVEKFDPAELYQYEQARNHSIALLKEWLVKYKFKNWKKTQGSGKTVTNVMKAKRAALIARRLNDSNLWHSHGRGISKDVLQKDLNLLIDDFGATGKENLAKKVKSYHGLLRDYMLKMGHTHVGAIHSDDHYRMML